MAVELFLSRAKPLPFKSVAVGTSTWITCLSNWYYFKCEVIKRQVRNRVSVDDHEINPLEVLSGQL